MINQRSKHIDLKYHFVRDCHFAKRVSLIKWPSTEQNADIMTKPFQRVKFEYFRLKLGLFKQNSEHLI